MRIESSLSVSIMKVIDHNIGLSPSGKAQDFDSCITVVRIHLAQFFDNDCRMDKDLSEKLGLPSLPTMTVEWIKT